MSNEGRIVKITPTVGKGRETMSSSIQFPMLNSTNYTVWAIRMKVALGVHEVWEVIDPGDVDPKKNNVAKALLFQSISEALILQIGEQVTAKGMWEAIKMRYMGAERVREARLQTLNSEFDRLMMEDSDTIDDFVGKLSELSSRSSALGETIEESKLVKKFLKSLLQQKFIHIIASLEQVLNLNTTGFEDIVGCMKAYEECITQSMKVMNGNSQDKLMFLNSDSKGSREGSSSHGRGRGGNRGRGRSSGRWYDSDHDKDKPKNDYSRVVCWRCDKTGHFAKRCPEKTTQEANLVDTQEADGALY